MTFYQRAFRYLWRKKTKTILLFTVLLAVSSMILCSIMILRATQDTKASIQEKTKSKVVMEITGEKSPITDADIQEIETLTNAASINRIASCSVYPSGFAPVTYNDGSAEENRKVMLLAYDDTESDGAFAEQKYRLIDGEHLNASHPQGILINFVLAEMNGIAVGDSMEFYAADGKAAQGIVIGIFQSGSERRQEDMTEAVYRIENQIYIDHALYAGLFNNTSYSKVSVYAHNPEQLAELESRIREILGDKVEITSSDALYQQMKAPLEQIAHVTKLMLVLTLLTAVIVVTLLLCMWMRARRKETAIFISLGEKKGSLYLQATLESLTVFLASVTGAALLGNFAARGLQESLLNTQESGVLLSVGMQVGDIGSLLLIGGLVVLFAVGVSLISTLRANPRDILSNMEG